MEQTKEITQSTSEKKLLTVLGLLNNCREKLRALYNLFNSNLLKAKTDSQEMSSLYDEAINSHNDLKGIATALSGKDNREKNIKASKPVVKTTKGNIAEYKQKFAELYYSFKHAFDDCMKLRADYKNEVVLCCDTYKKIKKDSASKSIEKGYRSQVNLIKAILDKIKSLILNYNKEDEKVEATKKEFDNMTKLVGTLADNLCALGV